MHEVGIIQDLINSIQKKISGRNDFKEVKKVYIRLGELMGVTEESLRFWFQALSKGTALEGAVLDINVVSGREIAVDSLEVE